MPKKGIGFGVVGLVAAGVVAWFILKRPKAGWVAGQPRPSPCNGVGDLDGDGLVGPSDVAIVQSYVLGAVQPTAEQVRRSDVRGDGEIDMGCLVVMESYYMGQIDTFPVCALV